MGTDIHVRVERREGAEWAPCDGAARTEEDGWPRWRSTWYVDRCYDLFAILADVRNGTGFAGCDTGDGFRVIAEPRGFPDDMSPDVAAWAKTVEHTPSWLTLGEILEFDWTQQTTHRGWVDARGYLEWSAFGRPKSWSGGVWGTEVSHVSRKAMGDLVRQHVPVEPRRPGHAVVDRDRLWELPAAEPLPKALRRVYTQVAWEEPYHASCPSWWDTHVPRLLALCPRDENGALRPADLRLVFYFDS